MDFYGLGILLYEMTVGKVPFHHYKLEKLKEQILTHQVVFPQDISPELKSLILMLMERDPMNRLGSKQNVLEVINHPWFKDVNLSQIAEMKNSPPIVPDIYQAYSPRKGLQAKDSLEEFLMGSVGELHDSVDSKEVSVAPNEEFDARFSDFSFYSNIGNPYEKYADSVYNTAREDYDDVTSINVNQLKANSTEGEFQGVNEVKFLIS